MARCVGGRLLVAGAAFVAALAASGCTAGGPAPGSPGDRPAEQFPVNRGGLATTGRSTYFVLEPGYQLTFTSQNGEQLVATVLDETAQVDGVTTRVFEERETRNGELTEISRNFLAIDPATGDLFYFGEDVDDYSGGQVVGHSGAWRSGVDGARFGLLVPGAPRVGQKHLQENAPGVAEDQAEVVSVDDSRQVPAGSYTAVLAVVETSALEPTVTSRKYYAPGIGLIQDDDLVLVKYGKVP